MISAPVAIMSFDRHDYLETVLQNLIRQRGVTIPGNSVHLFQDGAVSPLSGRRKADDSDISASVAVFRKYFPEGHVHQSADNLGVAFNFDRAERYFFETLGADSAIFLEDDMALSKWYFLALNKLLKSAVDSDHIGMVAAYGADWDLPLDHQHRNAHKVCLMDQHNWGFGLTRWHWQERNEIVSQYLDIIRPYDYKDRGKVHNIIFDWIRDTFGRAGPRYLSSQDSIKNMATEQLNRFRVSSFTVNAKYIGQRGEHMSPEKFAQKNYFRTKVYNRAPVDFEIPTAEELQRLHVERGYV